MMHFVICRAKSLRGEVSLPGDKSIAHRSIILSSLSRGLTRIENFPFNEDSLATIDVFNSLGIKINCKRDENKVAVLGCGLAGLSEPVAPIFIKESGTTFRLMLGVLAGQGFCSKLVAGPGLSKRPMLRVTAPLRKMGAQIKAKKLKREEFPPITVKGAQLRAIKYKMPVASAQVKSAILLAALYADGVTEIDEIVKTRDHTERMLKLFGADIEVRQNKILLKGLRDLVSPGWLNVPGDISSAAFFMVLGSIVPHSRLLLHRVNLNPSRMGIFNVLKRMGANIKIIGRSQENFEPVGDILVKSGFLKATVIKKNEIPSLIDELPILMVAAACAKGTSIFHGAGELRVKETDRIKSMRENLSKMGVKISVSSSNSIKIKGIKELKGAKVKSFGDHRTAMSMIVAGLCAKGNTEVDDVGCIAKSFPEFIKILDNLI